MTTVGAWLAEHKRLPRIDAELLVVETLDISRAQVLAHPTRELAPEQVTRLNQCATRLLAGEPLAYITGEREFWGLKLEVSPDVLVPRPETELLVEQACALAPTGARVLDLGTGSGAIAIAIAQERPDLAITATDNSQAALSVARRNALAHNARIQFVSSDWFDDITGAWRAIVSNPPYVAPDDPHLPGLKAEPLSALVAEDCGLKDIRTIIANAPEHLEPGGALLLEHGYDQAEAVRADLAAMGFEDIHSCRDLNRHERVTISSKPED